MVSLGGVVVTTAEVSKVACSKADSQCSHSFVDRAAGSRQIGTCPFGSSCT